MLNINLGASLIAAVAPATQKGVSAPLTISLGAGLIVIALTAQWLLSKRMKNATGRRVFSWVAWLFAVVGGTAITTDIQNQVGISSAGAAVASFVMLLVIAADLWDKRPDWLAFILICICPTFMRLAGGGAGKFYDLLLAIPAWAANWLGAFLGMS